MKKIPLLIVTMLAFCLFTLPGFAQKTILIVGDSLSAGFGIEVSSGWVALLKERLQKEHAAYEVINLSVSGDTTSNGLSRLPAALKQYQPKVTIIELGGNDGLRGIGIKTIKNNLQRMIALSKDHNSKVLLIGLRLPPNYGPAYTTQFNRMYADLGTENNIAVIPLFLKGIDEDADLMSPDGIHPTAKAQHLLLENVWPTLKDLLE